MSLKVGCLTIDAHDCRRLGAFWAAALDWTVLEETDRGAYLVPREQVDKDSPVPGILLFQTTDPKSVKNRIHLDLRPDDQEDEIARLEALGAARVDIGQRGDEPWVVMVDVEGNEFCVLDSRRSNELTAL